MKVSPYTGRELAYFVWSIESSNMLSINCQKFLLATSWEDTIPRIPFSHSQRAGPSVWQRTAWVPDQAVAFHTRGSSPRSPGRSRCSWSHQDEPDPQFQECRILHREPAEIRQSCNRGLMQAITGNNRSGSSSGVSSSPKSRSPSSTSNDPADHKDRI